MDRMMNGLDCSKNTPYDGKTCGATCHNLVHPDFDKVDLKVGD